MPKLGLVFPGQGSQFIGMLSDINDSYPVINEVFTEVSDKLGYDVWRLITDGPEVKLNKTQYTQVAMLAADVALFKIFESLGLAHEQIMAGHSLGEYAALVAANAISLADAAFIVDMRGQIMQEAVPIGIGAMAAIVGLSDAEVELICQQISSDNNQVMPANYNAIGQVVIAGHTKAVESALVAAIKLGAVIAKLLPVSVPCHCTLLTNAAAAFEEYLAKTNFVCPTKAVISNVDLSIYKSPQQIRKLLKEQLYRPVRWVETIQLMKKSDVEWVIECGPGKVLSGLVKRIEKTLTPFSINNKISIEKVLDLLRGSLQ